MIEELVPELGGKGFVAARLCGDNVDIDMSWGTVSAECECNRRAGWNLDAVGELGRRAVGRVVVGVAGLMSKPLLRELPEVLMVIPPNRLALLLPLIVRGLSTVLLSVWAGGLLSGNSGDTCCEATETPFPDDVDDADDVDL